MIALRHKYFHSNIGVLHISERNIYLGKKAKYTWAYTGGRKQKGDWVLVKHHLK